MVAEIENLENDGQALLWVQENLVNHESSNNNAQITKNKDGYSLHLQFRNSDVMGFSNVRVKTKRWGGPHHKNVRALKESRYEATIKAPTVLEALIQHVQDFTPGEVVKYESARAGNSDDVSDEMTAEEFLDTFEIDHQNNTYVKVFKT